MGTSFYFYDEPGKRILDADKFYVIGRECPDWLDAYAPITREMLIRLLDEQPTVDGDKQTRGIDRVLWWQEHRCGGRPLMCCSEHSFGDEGLTDECHPPFMRRKSGGFGRWEQDPTWTTEDISDDIPRELTIDGE